MRKKVPKVQRTDRKQGKKKKKKKKNKTKQKKTSKQTTKLASIGKRNTSCIFKFLL
jgi:hypothetical protein